MPDRDLPEQLKARLADELSSGTPLQAPRASQARYATAVVSTIRPRRMRGRVMTLAAAALVVLLAATFAGPPQPRAWLVRTVGNIAGDKAAPSPSPINQAQPLTSPSASSHRSQAPDTTPEQRESPVPDESPEAHDSPEPSQSPSGGDSSGGDGDQSSPSPTPTPSPDGDSDDGH